MASLKDMLQHKKDKVKETKLEETLKELESMPLEDLKNQVLEVGKYKNQSFKTAYDDESYLEWVVAHCPEDQRSSDGMRKYLIFVRRMLSLEVVEKFESGDLPKMPMTSKASSLTTKKDKGKGQELQSKTPYGPAVEIPVPVCEQEEEMESEWSAVVESHRVNHMEGEMVNLHHRMSSLEQAMQEMLYYMRSTAAASSTNQ